ncbi:MAG: isopenicillin N synthase family oxygenase [Rhodospirillaceae bacterium]|nr:isopenicillin N synthase family oxygenase [Rhodospirillaceae bacterium]
MPAIPHLGMAGADSPDGLRRFAAAMGEAYSDTGFAYVTGHGIPADVIAALFDASRRFHALPQAAKDAIAVNRHHRGYIASGVATDRASSVEAATRPNLSESFIKLSEAPPGREAWPLDGPNRWPDLPGFREAVTAFEAAAEPVARRLLAAMALGLGAAPERLHRLFDPPTVWLRLLRYPRRPADAPADRYGSAPHTDFGCLTLLLQDESGGLEVRAAGGDWIAAPPVDGALLVNTGDVVPVWSGGRWRSTPHRVVNPPDRDRYSIAYFFDPSPDARIAPLGGSAGASTGPPPFRFGDHVMAQLDATYAYRRETR